MSSGGITHYNAQKHTLIEALLPLCPFLLIDATRADVTVPESLKQPELVLRIGRDSRVMGMPDLVLDEAGWQATISLRGVRHHVSVPWEACSRCWVGEPFAGPVVVWPAPKPGEELPEKPKAPGLRLVKT
jgi:stringent starvation protein B